ncbi:MAG: hypothetical protein M3R38_03155 [Actinomycetota bacterium]|nr:hypothetical protein [Actinomycetota bacterium]
MAITADTSRTPHFWLLVAEEDGRVLTVGDDAAAAVFSGEGEAELSLHLAAGGGVWRVRRTSLGELASLLRGPSCSGAKSVALDPPPEMFADELLVGLISVGKERFLGRFAGRDGRGSEVPAAS